MSASAKWVLAALMLPLLIPAGAGATRIAGAVRDIPTGAVGVGAGPHVSASPRAHVASVSYGGGPVMHSTRAHLIFWQPAGSGLTFDAGYMSLIETFVAQVAADSHLPTNAYSLTGQYGDGSGPAAYAVSYAGAILDTDPVPTAFGCTEPLAPPLGTGPGWTQCVSDQEIENELASVVAARGLPSGTSDVYFVLTPNGLGSCERSGPDNCALGGPSSGYCGYHSVTSELEIVYAVIPYNAVSGHCQSGNPRPNSSTADPSISTLAHEHAEAATDPLGNAWADGQGNEIADLCITNYGPSLGGSGGDTAYDQIVHGGHYYIQELWSNVANRCQPSAQAGHVSFSAPGTVRGDRSVPLVGSATPSQGALIRSFDWFFGDGGRASRHRVAHAFTRAGVVTVELRTTDSWDNWAFASRAIRVSVPPPPVTQITGAPPSITNQERARFRFRSTAAIATFVCRVDHGAWRSCRSPFNTAPLSSGGHRFSVRGRDTFGQLDRSAASYAFTVV